MQSISLSHNWENGVKQIRLLKKICQKSCILCRLLRTKTLASGSKWIKHFFYFYHYFAHIWWVDVIYLISLMASLDILCFKPFNFKYNIMKIEHTKIFRGPSKTLKNISWPINICLKYFMAPTKTIHPPITYLMYGPLYCVMW